jgi:hypothetical protein
MSFFYAFVVGIAYLCGFFGGTSLSIFILSFLTEAQYDSVTVAVMASIWVTSIRDIVCKLITPVCFGFLGATMFYILTSTAYGIGSLFLLILTPKQKKLNEMQEIVSK